MVSQCVESAESAAAVVTKQLQATDASTRSSAGTLRGLHLAAAGRECSMALASWLLAHTYVEKNLLISATLRMWCP